MPIICIEQDRWLLHILHRISFKDLKEVAGGTDAFYGVSFSKLAEGTDPHVFLSETLAQEWFEEHPEVATVIVNNPAKKRFDMSGKPHPWVPILRCRRGLSGHESRAVGYWYALLFDLGVEILSAHN